MTNHNMRCMTQNHVWWTTCLDTITIIVITTNINNTSNNILRMTMEVRIIVTWCQLYLLGLRLLRLSSSSFNSLQCLLRTANRSGIMETDLNFTPNNKLSPRHTPFRLPDLKKKTYLVPPHHAQELFTMLVVGIFICFLLDLLARPYVVCFGFRLRAFCLYRFWVYIYIWIF